MTRSDEQIEQLLRGLPLRKPTAGLDERVVAPRATVGTPWLPLAVAAAVAAAVCLPLGYVLGGAAGGGAAAPGGASANGATAAVAAPRYVEVQWGAPRSGGAFSDSDGQLVYAVQQTGVERRSWYDEASGATIELTLPREQVQYVQATVY